VIERLLNRAARALVTRFGVSGRRVGWRHLPFARLDEFPHRILEPAGISTAPLPRNVTTREELSRDVHITGFSFHDVPERALEPTLIATIPRCRILIATDAWKDRHYAILTEDRRELRARGTYFQRALHAPLLDAAPVRLPRATWILEAWDRNYAHWLQWHLTKIVLLQRERLADDVVIPPRAGFVGASLDLLGADGLELPGAAIDVDELTVVMMDLYRPSMLHALRERVVRSSNANRKLYISRRDATRRRLLNEDECWRLLEARGYARVFMEDHSFREQVALMQEASAVVALHGAGLANVLFAPVGLHVLEIADVTFPNPQYYALSAAMGHHYWLLHAQPAGALHPGYHDLVADTQQLERALDGVDAALCQNARHD
jgi:capsular polysaccharide biosynthesis protein